MLSEMSTALLDFLFPPRCHICRSWISGAGRVHICPDCLASVRFITPPFCTVCGKSFDGAAHDHVCGACLHDRPHYDQARAAVVYDGICREMIHGLKYDCRTHLRRPLALLTAERVASFALGADMLVPVPLHVRRIRQRGFNQSILLGELLSCEWGMPLERRAMQRVRWTEPQINLSASERRQNVRGAFKLSGSVDVSGRRVILVDDVITTGSTVDECARVLRAGGAERVLVVTIARAQ